MKNFIILATNINLDGKIIFNFSQYLRWELFDGCSNLSICAFKACVHIFEEDEFIPFFYLHMRLVLLKNILNRYFLFLLEGSNFMTIPTFLKISVIIFIYSDKEKNY